MPAINAITPDKLARLIGTPNCPAIIDVRTADDFAADPRHLPGALRRNHAAVTDWVREFVERGTVVVCRQGRQFSEGVAAWLRHEGVAAEILDGGLAGWTAAGLPTIPDAVLPKRDSQGRTLWVTRARPKVDRIACPWLIRRFVDPQALFLFVSPSEVAGVAERFEAVPFDIEGDGVIWSHDGERCTFDVMVERFGLNSLPGLPRLAEIVRGADTGRPELAPQAAGLLAISLGLSRMYSDDLAQLEAGMLVYDALFRWCRDATHETHDWVSHQSKVSRGKAPA
jgi:rhodanese-related sulfurtransferase